MENTTKIIDHLQHLQQFDRIGNKLHQRVSKKRKLGSLDDWGRQQEAHNTIFDEEG
jgi:hypothetical protein